MNPCIVIADRARARLFSIEDSSDSPFGSGRRHLREHLDLVNPEGELTDRELFRDRRSGRRNRSSVQGGGYGIDDGRSREREQSTRRFVKVLGKAVSELVRGQKSKALVLVASPKFLGVARSEVRKAIPRSVKLTTLSEDLTRHGPARLETVLTQRGLFDMNEPVIAYRARTEPRGAKRAPRHKKARQ